MNISFLILSLFLLFSSKAQQIEQAQGVAVSSGEYSVLSIEEGEYQFPILIGGDSEVAHRVNSYLSNHYLELELGQEKESIFENVNGNDEYSIAGLAFMNYEVERLDDKFYTLRINGEGCGAYCEEFESFHNFNLLTGELISIYDLLTEEGAEKLEQQVTTDKRNKIKEQIAFAKAELKKPDATDDDKEYYEMQIDLYEGCSDFDYELLYEYTDYYLSDDSSTLTIITDRCSPHAYRALDDLGEFVVEIDLADYAGLLSEFGKSLLL